jgi:hypothetical protein
MVELGEQSADVWRTTIEEPGDAEWLAERITTFELSLASALLYEI